MASVNRGKENLPASGTLFCRQPSAGFFFWHESGESGPDENADDIRDEPDCFPVPLPWPAGKRRPVR